MQVGSIVYFIGNLTEANEEIIVINKEFGDNFPLMEKEYPYKVIGIGDMRDVAIVPGYESLYKQYIITDKHPFLYSNINDFVEVLPPSPIEVEDIILQTA